MGYCIEVEQFSVLVCPASAVTELKSKWACSKHSFYGPDRWSFETSGNWATLKAFVGDKLGDDYDFWRELAPYVAPTSYIEFRGEDDAEWRWEFKNGQIETTLLSEFPPSDPSVNIGQTKQRYNIQFCAELDEKDIHRLTEQFGSFMEKKLQIKLVGNSFWIKKEEDN